MTNSIARLCGERRYIPCTLSATHFNERLETGQIIHSEHAIFRGAAFLAHKRDDVEFILYITGCRTLLG